MDDHIVLWNGDRRSAAGPYLCVEEEQAPAVPDRPCNRPCRDLRTDEVQAILDAAPVLPHATIARRFGVDRTTVDHLVRAARDGYLRRA